MDTGRFNGGRWGDAYPLVFDLVTDAYRAMHPYIYLLLGVVLLVCVVLTYRDKDD